MKDYVWKPWKVGAMAVAGLLLIAGGAMALFGSGETAPAGVADHAGGAQPLGSTGGAAPIPGAKGFSGSGGASTRTPAPGTTEPRAATSADESTTDLLSPTLVRGGISFFAAFALAFALRSFLKLFLIFSGVWVASLFFLSSLGWIEVHWGIIDDQFVGWTQTLGAQFESLSTFITGSLPSAGLAGLGLVAGLKKG